MDGQLEQIESETSKREGEILFDIPYILFEVSLLHFNKIWAV